MPNLKEILQQALKMIVLCVLFPITLLCFQDNLWHNILSIFSYKLISIDLSVSRSISNMCSMLFYWGPIIFCQSFSGLVSFFLNFMAQNSGFFNLGIIQSIPLLKGEVSQKGDVLVLVLEQSRVENVSGIAGYRYSNDTFRILFLSFTDLLALLSLCWLHS